MKGRLALILISILIFSSISTSALHTYNEVYDDFKESFMTFFGSAISGFLC